MICRKNFIALFFASVFVAGPAYSQNDQNKTLVVAVSTDPANLEPGTNKAEPIGSEIIFNVFDTLVSWKAPAFKDLEGRLAKSWTVSPDGKTFAFKLRPGVMFHDGTPLDAESVKFSIERTRDINPYMKSNFGLIESISVQGALDVKITLKEPMPVFLSLLAQPQAAVVSPTAVKKFGDKFNVNPVGTGPFMFKSYTPDTNVVLEANAGYFRGKPKLERILYRVIPDASTRRLEMEKGGIDISQQNAQLSSIPADELKAFKDNKDIEVIEVPSQIIRQLEFNNNITENSPIKDVRVRKAITYAIDYDGLLKGVLGGTADRVYGPLTTNSWAFNPKMKAEAPNYDPTLARKMLQEAGVKPGDLKFTLYSFQGSLWGAMATLIKSNLADVGIEVTIAQTEFPSYRALQTAGKFELALDGRQPWYNDPDAHITIGYLSSLANSAMTFRMPKDPALDALILKAQTTVDFKKRKELYYEVQEAIANKVPGAYLFSPKLIVFKRANVKGLVVNSAPPLNEYWNVSKQ